MEKMRIIFMGTPDFAVTILQTLLDYSYSVIGVITQPDRPVGRNKVITPSPVKVLANQYQIPVFQTEKIRKDYSFVQDLKPDLIITCAYGQIIPQAMLDIPRFGCINVHASLLPKLRGGAPIHHAIIDGYNKTGVTIMRMIDRMDAGEIYAMEECTITEEDNLESLYNKLKVIGAQLLIRTLPSIIDGSLQGKPQDESQVTFGYNIKREEERINWNKSGREVFNLIRGLSPHPGAYTMLNNEVVKIYQSKFMKSEKMKENGEIISDKGSIFVQVQDGILEILELQVAGKKKVSSRAFINGLSKSLIGERFI